eukprot:COSAG02_NODE_1338_length_13189_cov_28.102292_8_plen_101_part_00
MTGIKHLLSLEALIEGIGDHLAGFESDVHALCHCYRVRTSHPVCAGFCTSCRRRDQFDDMDAHPPWTLDYALSFCSVLFSLILRNSLNRVATSVSKFASR